MQSEQANSIEEIEYSLQVAKQHRDIAHEMDILGNNPTFKEVFLEGYLGKNIVDLVGYRASLEAGPARDKIDDAINAAGHLAEFLRAIRIRGRTASETISSHEEMLTELRNTPVTVEG